MPNYITAEDYTLWRDKPDEEVPDLEQYVITANKQLARAIRNDWYATDPAGLPIEPVYTEAIQKAGFIQILSWFIGGVSGDDLIVGDLNADAEITATKIGSGAVTINDGRAARARAIALRQLTPGAFDELRAVGLGSPIVGGTQGSLW